MNFTAMETNRESADEKGSVKPHIGQSPVKAEKNSMWQALSIAWELGYVIALPIVIFGFTGAYLDKKYGTSPWLLLLGIVLAAVLTVIGIYRKVKKFTL